MARLPVRKARSEKDKEEKASNIAIKKKEKTVGRPNHYETHVKPHLDKIYEWLKEGYTDYSIADSLGIHYNTFSKYKEKFTDLNELYTRARTHKNALVMHKQFEKAVGYEHEDLFIAQYQGKIVEKKIKKYYPPDVNAADLYLRNNDPEYRSAKMVEIGGSTTINFNMAELTSKKEELLSELQKLQAIDVETKQLE